MIVALLTVVNMTRRTGASAKTQALAKATEAMARRDAERIEREKRLQSVLAEFFHAQGEAERIRSAADVAAAPFDGTMRDSVCTLDGLGETRAGIASLTGLPVARVREYLADSVSEQTAHGAKATDDKGARPGAKANEVETGVTTPEPTSAPAS